METQLVKIQKEINRTLSKKFDPAEIPAIADYLIDIKYLKDKVQEYFEEQKKPLELQLEELKNEESEILKRIDEEEGKWRGIVNNIISKAIQDGQVVDKNYEGEKGKITMIADVEIEIIDIKALVKSIIDNAYGENGWKFIEAKKGEIKKFIKATGFTLDGVSKKDTAYMKLIEKK